MSYLKGDCINNAYQELRISGLTVQPSSKETATALRRLEGMANEFFRNNICVGYNFEDSPDENSTAGIPIEFQEAFELCLTKRLASIFGKGAADKVDPSLNQRQSGAYSYLSGATAVVPRVQSSSRMPIGSGNERQYSHYSRFYKTQNQIPTGCAVNKMVIGDINDFVEHFDSYLIDSEVISTYTIEATSGLTIVSDSLSSPDVIYRISAVGGSSENPDGLYQVKIVVTTDDSRVTTRLINFELVEVDIA